LISLNARLLFLPPELFNLRAGARVVSHETLKPFIQILAIGRVLSTRLSAIRSAAAQRRPMPCQDGGTASCGGKAEKLGVGKQAK